MSYEWLEMQREAERHLAIEQYLRNNLITEAYGSPSRAAAHAHYIQAQAAAQVAASSPPPGVYPATTPPPQYNLPITKADKIRMTFIDLDTNKDGVIDAAEFDTGLVTCKITLTDSAAELFAKAKGGNEGSLTEPEWYAFISEYPMLLEALYHRFRQITNAEREAQAANDAKERLAERVAQLQKELEGADQQLQQQSDKLNEDTAAADAATAKAQESADAHRDAISAVENAFRDRQETEKKVASEWEATREQRIRAAEANRDIDIATRRLQAAEEREKWAQQALDAARKEREEAANALEQANQKKVEVQSPTEDPEVVLSNADRRVADAQRKEYELGVAASEDAARADRAKWAKDEQDRLKATHDARRNRLQDALTEAEKSCTENDERLREAEEVKASGVSVDEKENELVQQEVDLKKQRDLLNEKESNLHRECTEFTQRVSPQRERAAASPATHSPYASVQRASPYTTPTKTY